MFLLLDAANTLIHKPGMVRAIVDVLQNEGFVVDADRVASRHRLTSEFVVFPDRTDRVFYAHFNGQLLMALGICPTTRLVDGIYEACRGLRWEPFPDALRLAESGMEMGVVSNFHTGLEEVLRELFGDVFRKMAVSENAGIRKPDQAFYRLALQMVGKRADQVRYVGDSVRLDLIPAIETGMDAWLIDRDGTFRDSNRRIEDLMELTRML